MKKAFYVLAGLALVIIIGVLVFIYRPKNPSPHLVLTTQASANQILVDFPKTLIVGTSTQVMSSNSYQMQGSAEGSQQVLVTKYTTDQSLEGLYQAYLGYGKISGDEILRGFSKPGSASVVFKSPDGLALISITDKTDFRQVTVTLDK